MAQFDPYCTQVSVTNNAMGSRMDNDWGLGSEESVPTVGISCKHCKNASNDGKQSKGCFLSSKADTMSRNKNLQRYVSATRINASVSRLFADVYPSSTHCFLRMFNHMVVCAPEDIKTRLVQAKNIHLPQSDRLKKGWKKHFFENVCSRLDSALELDTSGGSSDVDDQPRGV